MQKKTRWRVVSEVYRWYTLEARFCKLLDNGNTPLVQVWVWEEFARVAPRANSKFMRTIGLQMFRIGPLAGFQIVIRGNYQ